MYVKSIEAKNFKSFRNLSVEFQDFSVIIGANAAGKSNFTQILKFISDVEEFGLNSAVSIQGGIEYLKNKRAKRDERVQISVALNDIRRRTVGTKQQGTVIIEMSGVSYQIALGQRRGRRSVHLESSSIDHKFRLLQPIAKNSRAKQAANRQDREVTIGEGNIRLKYSSPKLNIEFEIPDELKIEPRELFGEHWTPLIRDMYAEYPLFDLIVPFGPMFRRVKCYDFDPKLPQRASPYTGKQTLESDGSNIAIVLKKMLDSKPRSIELMNLMRDMLPFVDRVQVKDTPDKSLIFMIKECFAGSSYLPAFLISEGTINLTALLIALFFEPMKTVILEEPERNLHPQLIERLVGLMRDASRKRQILVTTHNPLLVKYAGLDNLLLVSRDSDGNSIVQQPKDQKHLTAFLKEKIGLDNLFIDGILEL